MTRPKNFWGWLIAAALIAVPAWALAEAAADGGGCPCHQHGGAGAHAGMAGRHWDPKTVTQVQGSIEELQAGPRGHGVHLVLAVGTEKLRVMVGPASYVEQQGMKLAQGDVIEVKGSRLTRGDTAVLVAQELKKGDQTLTLRDVDGTPRWADHHR